MTRKLNQVLAVEKGIKTRVNETLTNLHRVTQKAELLNGFTKTYQPVQESGKVLPPESQKVQVNASEAFKDVTKALTELFDVTATKDFANCDAKADVKVNGTVLLAKVPSTYLLFLDKQLTDLNTFVSKVAELDNSVDWTKDTSSGLYKSEAVKTHRTEKVQRAIVLYDATEHHPAQTQLITEDQLVGHWTTVRLSGALPRPEKVAILERIKTLHQAVKEALEVANTTQAPDTSMGAAVLSYIFG